MTIWHKRGEFPHGFAEENKLFVYVFDDGVDVVEYCEKYHKFSNLKKWCVFNELCGLEKRLRHTQDLELDTRRKLEIAVKALEYYADKGAWCESKISLGLNWLGPIVIMPKSAYKKNGYKLAEESLAKIKEIK